MEDHSAILRPSLLSLQPARLAAALRPLGIAPRELALQAALPTPLPDGWGVVPPIPTSPLLLDLVGMDLLLIATLLSDLRLRQREQGGVPLILVPSTAVGERRIVSASALSSVVAAADIPAEALARWIRAPVRIRPGQIWLRALPLALPGLDPHFVPLLAALGRATSVAQAAQWCYLAERTAYLILSRSCRQLGVPLDRRRSPPGWAAALAAALEAE